MMSGVMCFINVMSDMMSDVMSDVMSNVMTIMTKE